jgi:DNA-binding MarR family transcriptional regulator
MNKIVDHTNASELPRQEAGAVMFTLLHAAHLLESRMEEALAAVGLSMAKYGALELLIEAKEPLPLSELAARAKCVRSNMTQLVDRLEAEGLVQRIDDPADRRVTRAQLTPAGRERYAAGVRQMEQVQANFMAEVPEMEREALARVLSVLT